MKNQKGHLLLQAPLLPKLAPDTTVKFPPHCGEWERLSWTLESHGMTLSGSRSAVLSLEAPGSEE